MLADLRRRPLDPPGGGVAAATEVVYMDAPTVRDEAINDISRQRKQISLYSDVKTPLVSRERRRELLALCGELKALSGGAAACADALDFLGYRRCCMDPAIRPFFPHKGRMCGLA